MARTESGGRNWWDLHESVSQGLQMPDSLAHPTLPGKHNSSKMGSSGRLPLESAPVSWNIWKGAWLVMLEVERSCNL